MTTQKYNTATISIIDIVLGHPLEGLMTRGHKFYVAIDQIANRFATEDRQSSIDILNLLGNIPESTKLKVYPYPEPVSAIPLDSYRDLVFELARKGNTLAIIEFKLAYYVGMGHSGEDLKKIQFEVFAKAEEDKQSKKSKKKDNSSFIYVIGWEGSECVKIGRTNCLSSRLAGLQTSSPYKLRIEWTVKTDSAVSLEYSLHSKLRKHKAEGEWFSREPAVAAIKEERYCKAYKGNPAK